MDKYHEKKLQGLQEGRGADVYLELQEQHSRKYQILKHQAMMAYMDLGFKKLCPSMTDKLCLLSKCLEEARIPYWKIEKHRPYPKKTPKKESSPATIDR